MRERRRYQRRSQRVAAMPRYYCHLKRGRMTIVDRIGVDLVDLAHAIKEGARRALEIEARENLEQGSRHNGAIIVEDESSTLLEVPFGGAPATLLETFRRAPLP